MKKFFKEKSKKYYILVGLFVSFLISIIFLELIYTTCGIWFETNDDVFISEILAGKIIGISDYHIIYVNPILSFPLSLLYKVLPGISWWGIFILLCLGLSVFICIYSVFYKAKNLWQFLIGSIVVIGVFVAGIHNFGQAQYTSAAMLLAVSGYVVLLCFDVNVIPVVTFVLCEFLALNLRQA